MNRCALVVVTLLLRVVWSPSQAGAAPGWMVSHEAEPPAYGQSVGVAPNDDVFLGIGDGTVARLAARDGALFWREPMAPGYPYVHLRQMVATPDGEVVAAGRAGTALTTGRWVVTRLKGDGSMRWTDEILPVPPGGTCQAIAVALDGDGNVVAAGSAQNTPGQPDISDITVVKYDGATGATLWRHDLRGTAATGPNGSRAVAVDGGGDVVVAGATTNTGTGLDFTVVKLAGVDGTELWRANFDGTATAALTVPPYTRDMDEALVVAVQPSGDVVAAGYVDNEPGYRDVMAVKLAGATGVTLWRVEQDGSGVDPPTEHVTYYEGAQALAVDAAGNAYVGGSIFNATTRVDFLVSKLAAADGATLWQQQIDGMGHLLDRAFMVRVDAAGEIVAAGMIQHTRTADFAVVRLAAADGSVLWSQTFNQDEDDTYNELAQDVAFDAAGDVLVSGVTDDDGSTVVKLDGTLGARVAFVAGKRLALRERPGVSPDRKLGATLRDPAIVPPPAGDPADPMAVGASLLLVDPAVPTVATISLPAANWRATVRTSGVRYDYRDPDRLAGPCRRVRLRPGEIMVKCRGAGLGFALDTSPQGQFGLRLATAGVGGTDYCATFGGTVVRDTARSFAAKKAPPPAACP